MKTSNNRYKILVLSDLKNNVKNTLKSTLSLAKMVDGDIQFFHVKGASEIVGTENQLSAMRTINREYITTENKIKKEVKSFSSDYDTNIQYAFSFGSIKEEIGNYINEYQPDIVVLGKRKKTSLSFIGDHVTQFVMKKHKGAVMIASDDHILEPDQSISLGLLDEKNNALNVDFANNLIQNAQRPLKSFKVVKNSDQLEKNPTPANQDTVEYVFEQNDNVIKNLSNYLSKNNVNLLCVNRENDYAINKLNVSLLVAN
ncbi:MAG: universal stress protein [Flavobacteriaceae bacterium]